MEGLCRMCGGMHASGTCQRQEPSAEEKTQTTEQLRAVREDAERIPANAKRDGTYLKVKNRSGELVDSALSPEQWVTVRTAAFKAWFGDWENNPEHASTVVDEHGEPLVVFHGAKRSFTVFDTDNASQIKSGSYKNVGGFFTTDYKQALDYTYVNALDARYSGEALPTAPADDRVIRAFLNVRKLKNYRENGKPSLGIRALTPELRDLLRKEGYDAVRFRYDTEFVVFDANQIKSADANVGHFDPQNTDIHF